MTLRHDDVNPMTKAWRLFCLRLQNVSKEFWVRVRDIFQPEESTVKIFTDSVSKRFYRAEPESFSPALGMREWLKIRLALCQIEQALSASSLPGYALEEQVCG